MASSSLLIRAGGPVSLELHDVHARWPVLYALLTAQGAGVPAPSTYLKPDEAHDVAVTLLEWVRKAREASGLSSGALDARIARATAERFRVPGRETDSDLAFVQLGDSEETGQLSQSKALRNPSFTCQTCAFFDAPSGTCRRNPPTTAVPSLDGSIVAGDFPRTHSTWWCGEHRRKDR